MKKFSFMLKNTLVLLLVLLLTASCAAAEGTRIAALKGPTAMGMVQMMDAPRDGFSFEICASADEITPRLLGNSPDFDIAALPANLASVLYNRTNGGVRVLAINTLGVMYIVERGDAISSAEDLRGKTIYTAGKGSTPEYVLNYILEMNGLTPDRDVHIEFRAEHSECLSALMNDAQAVAMLPQPFVTTALTKAQDMRVALDLTEEWEKLGNGTMITGVIVARSDFIEEQPETIAAFLEDYAASVRWVNENTADAAQLVGKFDIVPAAIAEKALPECNICFYTGEDLTERLVPYLQVLFEAAPESVGGTMPDEDFYYIHEAAQ